ncbi:hypothetical protein JCM11251_007659 [Rhodosporidiobolus azoricus]
MPFAVPELPIYERPPATKERLDLVELHTLDLSKLQQAGGKEELVKDLSRAIENVGFLLVKGHGIEDDEVRRQLAIGKAFFELPIEEKRQHPCNFEIGHYFGYRENKEIYEGTNIRNPIEMLNSPKDTAVLADEQLKHDFVEPFRGEIGAFSRKVHSQVLDPLLRLFALLLELPEDYLAAPHAYDQASEDHLRYMNYSPLKAEEYERLGNQSVKGHTDFGVLTILFPQIISTLQVQTAPGEYKYTPYIPGHIVVNTAEVLTYVTGGYIKSTVHRVVRPPADQLQYNRLGLLYFSRPANSFPIKVVPSPLLQRLGIYDPAKEDPNPPNGLEWGRARVKHSHYKPDQKIKYNKPQESFRFGDKEVNLEYASPAIATEKIGGGVPPVVAASA